MIIKCTNCNSEQEYNEDNKFCMMCGSILPSPMKKCISCNKELPLDAKFCSSCGTKQETSSNVEQVLDSKFHMGNDNMIAGDFNVVGKKEETHIENQTIIKNEDETKQVKTCHICGENKTILEGHNCPKCGKFTCKNCFDLVQSLCKSCSKIKAKDIDENFKKLIKNFLSDGIIDKNERLKIKEFQTEFNLSDERALYLENEVTESLSIDSMMTTIEKHNLEKAIELFYEYRNIAEAYDLLQPLYEKYPQEEKILNIYLPVLLKKDFKELTNILDNSNFDCLSINLAKIDIALMNMDLDNAERNLIQAKDYANNNIIKYYEVLLNILIEKKTSDRSFFKKAHEIIDSMMDSQEKLEKTFKVKAQIMLANAERTPISFITEQYCEENNLYTYFISEAIEVYVGIGCDYELIQDAINQVPEGSIIYVKPGIYNENLVIDKEIKIIGVSESIREKASEDLPIVITDINHICKISSKCEISGIVFTQNKDISFKKLNDYISVPKDFNEDREFFAFGSENWVSCLWITADAMLKNIAVLDSKDYGITVTEGNPNIRESIIYSCYICGLDILDLAGGTYEKCEILHTNKSCLRVKSQGNPFISNSILHGSLSSCGLLLLNESSGTYENCEIYETKYAGIEVAEKSNPQVNACKIHNIPENRGIYIYEESTGTYENCEIFKTKYAGIQVTEKSNPQVKSCKIHNILENNGIRIFGESSGTYENCEIFNTEDSAIVVKEKSNPHVKNCKIYESHDGCGIQIYGESSGTYENCEIFKTKYAGIEVSEKSNPQVKACKIYNILENGGIRIYEESSGTYENCEIFNTEGSAIVVNKKSNPQVKACKIHNIPENIGIFICGESTGIYENCEIFNTKKSAILVNEKSNPLVKNCKIYESHDGNGICICGESSGTYKNCEIFKTKYAGIEVAKKSNPQVIACKIHNILENGGIYIYEESLGTYENCEIYETKYAGIYVGEKSNPQVNACKIHNIPENIGIFICG